MKIRIPFAIMLICYSLISFGQQTAINPKTMEVLSQTKGEKFYFKEDWNNIINVYGAIFNIKKNETPLKFNNYYLSWADDKFYIKTTINQAFFSNKFEIDETKNTTASLDVEILIKDNSYDNYAGLSFGGVMKNKYVEGYYVFVVGRGKNETQFKYKILQVKGYMANENYEILKEGEIDDLIDYETMTNTLKVERVGNTFNFIVNSDKVETLDFTNATINTKYVGFWQTGNQFRVGYDNLVVTGTNTNPNSAVPKIETEKKVKVVKETKADVVKETKPVVAKDKLNDCTIFYKGFPTEDKDDIAFFKKLIADAGNKFKNYENKKFKTQQRRTDVMSDAVTRIGNSISFDIKEFATLDEAMIAAKNYLYNAQLALGNNKTTCWQLDEKLSSKNNDNFTNCYLITNANNTSVKVRIWVSKYSADKVDVQISVSDK